MQYDETFFDYVNEGAVRSAQEILPHLQRMLNVRSVLDVGCGQGAWLSVWQHLGVNDLCGVDGDYVERAALRIQASDFYPRDLAEPFALGRRFDLVQSLEVAEHLPPSSARGFIDSLVKHGDIILFSAAAEGQGGDHHVNEQHYDYWRALFAEHSYVPFDCIRPRAVNDRRIEPWYRYNSFLYVAAERIADLPESLHQFRIADGTSLQDISPLAYRLRKRLVRALPVHVVTRIAKLKERWRTRRKLLVAR